MMADEKNQPITPKGFHHSGRGRGGRGSNSRPRSQSFSSTGKANDKDRGSARGLGRSNGNHGRQPRQETNNYHHRSNQRQKSRSYSHHDNDYKRAIEGPYAHLFCSERHGFALSRVLYPTEETTLFSCFKDGTSPKITSSQLEKWWECVKLVRCHVPYDETSPMQSILDRCPICLDEEMIAPHISPCGHTYCLPCVLGYLNSVAKELNTESDRICKSKQKSANEKALVGNATKASVAVTTVRARCPMCSSGSSAELNVGDAMITYKDLRPVVFAPVLVLKAKALSFGKQQNQCSGTKMRFVKLHRVMDSLSPYLPVHGRRVFGGVVARTEKSPILLPPDLPDGDDDSEECVYSRQYFVGCNEYGTALQRCLDDLNKYSQDSAYCQVDTREKWNVSMAIEAVQASLRRWIGSGGDGGFLSMEYEAKTNFVRGTTLAGAASTKIDGTTAERESVQHDNCALLPPGTIYLDRELNESLYFQACDGQLCFLSGINMACLLEEFSLHQNEHQNDMPDQSRRAMPLPDSIEGTVLEIESIIVTPELARRKHFLSHLPLGSSVLFAEIDWYSGGSNASKPMLTKATLNKFREDIQRRKSDRQRAAKIEIKNDKAARIKSEKEEIRRRKEAFGSASLDGASRQKIDPEDDFFKTPALPSEEETNQQNRASAFSYNQVCAEMGAFPELQPRGSTSPVPRKSVDVSSPSLVPAWGSASRKCLDKNLPVRTDPRIEPFSPLAAATQNKRDEPSSVMGRACWNK